MLKMRRSNERGNADHGWLKSKHTFSFANYYDPAHMGFRSLRVINEDRIAPGSGFGAHTHSDMEIISYVVKGSLAHQDSMGNKITISPGEVQRMSAGTGVVHSEFSTSDVDTHFFQIWIPPNKTGIKPSYAQKSFEQEIDSQEKVLVISQDGREGSLSIQQDANVYVSKLKSDQEIQFDVRTGRGVWIQIIKGEISVGDKLFKAGDAFSTEDAQTLLLKAKGDSEFFIFDLGQ